ncbi:glycosyltransferase family 2 protein [Lysobacter sp. A421]
MLRSELDVTRKRRVKESLHLLRQFGVDALESDPALLEKLWSRYAASSGVQEDEAYNDWIANAELVVIDDPVVRCRDERSSTRYLFTVVLLPGDGLEARLASLVSQTFDGFQLLVPRSAVPQVPETLKWRTASFEDADGKQPFPGVDEAEGSYVLWLPPDQTLPKEALSAYAAHLSTCTDCVLAYGDEDFVDREGVRHSPYFKPDWDPELLAGQDYPGWSVVLERGYALQCRDEIQTSAWLYGACLRVKDSGAARRIARVPRIVRHHMHAPGPVYAPLRVDGENVRGSMAAEVARWALGTDDVLVADRRTAHVRIRRKVPKRIRADIVIPTKDRVDLLSTCIRSVLERTDGVEYRITIVDNRSEEESTARYLQEIARDSHVKVVRDQAPFNYSSINNRAVADCDGDVVVLMNNDIEVIGRDWLAEMVSNAIRPGIGVVGARLLYPDHTLQHAGVILGVKGVAAHAYSREDENYQGQYGRALFTQSFSAVTAACLAVKRTHYNAVGGLDPRLAVAFNDIDFCLRVGEAGLRNLWTPHALLYHHESASRGAEDTPEKTARFAGEVAYMQERWRDVLQFDPAYSPNLSLTGEPFTIDPDRVLSN